MLTLVISGCRSVNDPNQISPIVYLGWDEKERIQIYYQYADDDPKQITDLENSVIDYSIAPDGKTIAYSTMVADGASSIRQIGLEGRGSRLLLTCQQAECNQIVWANDNRRLIYEKRAIGEDGVSGSPTIWWLDTGTGETKPVLEDSNARGSGARFSADGQWLGYVSPEEEGAIIYNLDDGRTRFVADEIGVPVAWHPEGEQIVVPNLDLVIVHGDEGADHLQHTHDYETTTHIFAFDVETGSVENISGDLRVEDGVPAWSPDGEWIAFGRRFPSTAAGRQLWLMKADGTEQRALADDPDINYGPPYWSSDGRFLLFQRFVMENSDEKSAIWLLDIETGQMSELAAEAMQPAWLAAKAKN